MIDALIETSNRLNDYLKISSVWKTKKLIKYNNGILVPNSIVQINHSMQQASAPDYIPVSIYTFPDTYKDNNGMCKFICNFNLNINEFEEYFEPCDKIKTRYETMLNCKYNNEVYNLRIGIFNIVLGLLIIAISAVIAFDFLNDKISIPLIIYIMATTLIGITALIGAVCTIMHNKKLKKIYKAYAVAIRKATRYD